MIRFPTAAAAMALFAFTAGPALAQTTAPAPAAPAPSTSAPATAPAASAPSAEPAPATSAPSTTAPSTTAPAAKHHAKRMSLEQRFTAANTAHDGHLTKDEAVAAKWTYVNRHFDAIDKDHKGYVTTDDIHAYAHVAHAARRHHTTTAAPADSAPATAPAAPATTN